MTGTARANWRESLGQAEERVGGHRLRVVGGGSPEEGLGLAIREELLAEEL